MSEAWSPKRGDVLVLVGTKKGGFIFQGRKMRRRWKIHGPYFEGWGVLHFLLDGRDQRNLYAAVDTAVWGSSVFRSRDFGASWDYNLPAPHFPEGSGQTLIKPWHVEPGRSSEGGVLYAGVEPAALFRSADAGESWRLVQGLEGHPTRPGWQPGNGGLCLHSIVLDPEDARRLYVGISAVGVFRSDDGGATWAPKNKGVPADFLPYTYPEWGQCVHKLLLHPAKPRVLYQQNHCGTYRSDDAGDTWVDIGEGRLPSRFGFPILIHPHDSDTVYVVPEESAELRWVSGGRMAVYRSRDRGESWRRLTRGLPREKVYTGVLREGMAADSLDPAGIYVGTKTGQLFASRDEGDTWELMADFLPPIYSVETALIV